MKSWTMNLFPRIFLLAVMMLSLGEGEVLALSPPEPVVAIHVSELTRALETMPAKAPTPTGSGQRAMNGGYLPGIIS